MSPNVRMREITREFADVLARASYIDLSSETRAHTQRCILDWLGSTLAGAIEPPARMVQKVVARFGSSDEATVFMAGRACAAAAALANGTASHILELDDLHKGSTLHPAAPIIPAALAVAEREHAHGREFATAVTLGYEAAFRVGEAVNPSHYHFWHPTGTAATFGATVAVGSLLKLSPNEMLHALGSAGTQAAGLWEFNTDGAMSKHLHAGKAAFHGVLSADLARAGFTGATRILEGDRGFCRAMSSAKDLESITAGLGKTWKIGENCYKLHPCCGHTHTAIDLALGIRSKRNWSAEDVMAKVQRIDIETYSAGYEVVKEINPRSPYQAKFSIAYCVAAALLDGNVSLAQFSPERFSNQGVCDESYRHLLSRTRVTVAEDLNRNYPSSWSARLVLTLKDQSRVSGKCDYPHGHAENPVTTRELENKFVALVATRYGPEAANTTLKAVQTLDNCTDMATLFRDVVLA